MNYYVRVGDHNQGPFTLEELRLRGVDPDEFIWREGLPHWQKAGLVPEVASALRKKTTAPAQQTPQSGDFASPYAAPQSQVESDTFGPTGQGEVKHSGWGIASTIMGVVTVVLQCGLLMFFGYLRDKNPQGNPEDDPVLMATAFACCGSPLLNVLALIFAVVGIFQENRYKLFGIVGAVINGLVVFSMLGFALLLLAIGATFG